MSQHDPKTNRTVRTAVILALLGLLCTTSFLFTGFRSWSVGVGVFLGAPTLLSALVLYIYAVIRDLRNRGAL